MAREDVRQLSEVTRNTNTVVTQFRQASNDNTRNMSKIVKDLSSVFKGQRSEISSLNSTIDENINATNRTATKVDQTNNLMQETINIQNRMLSELKNLARTVKEGNITQREETVSWFGKIYNALTGTTAKVVAGAAAGAYAINEASKYDPLKPKLPSDSLPSEKGNTNFTGKELDAKKSAEKYIGRELKPNEWSELVRATNAEAGRSNQTEVAMVMATILNRAKNKNESIENILREKNQFQAVTGTKYDPNPSPNFLNSPNQKRLDQIYGAATNILEKVSSKQVNFTAASAAAYGPGTNIGYRETLLRQGGQVVGGSVFNTAPPTISDKENKQTEKTQGNVPKNDIVALGKYLQEKGLRISEHPSFGGVLGKHSRTGGHYDGSAIDVNVGKGIVEAHHPEYGKMFDQIAEELRQSGYKVIWRAPGHENHMHISAPKQGSAERVENQKSPTPGSSRAMGAEQIPPEATQRQSPLSGIESRSIIPSFPGMGPRSEASPFSVLSNVLGNIPQFGAAGSIIGPIASILGNLTSKNIEPPLPYNKNIAPEITPKTDVSPSIGSLLEKMKEDQTVKETGTQPNISIASNQFDKSSTNWAADITRYYGVSAENPRLVS